MVFHVAFADAIRERLIELRARVKPLGLSGELARALASLQECLTKDPLGFGEIKYTTKHRKLPVCSLVRGYLSATYLIDESTNRVFVTNMKMLNPNPFPSGFETLLNDQ